MRSALANFKGLSQRPSTISRAVSAAAHPALHMATATATKPKKGAKGEFNITVPTITKPAVNAAAIEKLITARIGLLIRAPFFGNMATRLVMENADDWLATAATDGRKFYYNSEFIALLSQKETEFLFGHEVLHNCYTHMDRCGSRDKMLFNVACDYVVNADLIDQRIGEKITSVPMLFDPKYKGMAAEEVYDILYEQADKIDIGDLMDQLLDDHMDDDDSEDGDGDSEDGDKDGKNGKGKPRRPKLTEEEKKQIRDEIKEAMISAAQAVGAGNTPLGVQRQLQDLLEPKMNWRELLQQQIESTIKSDFTWLRPSRRAWHCDAIMPGMKPGDTIDVAVAIDTSGSISQRMLQEFLTEVHGIMEAYDDYKITIWTFDTETYNPQVYTQDNGSDIMDYDIQGGGGTDFMANWRYMQEADLVPKKLIVFTDGYPYGEWGIEDYCDTVWIINGNKDAKPPFGIWAHYSDS